MAKAVLAAVDRRAIGAQVQSAGGDQAECIPTLEIDFELFR